MMITMLNCDCMSCMATLPDKAFELAIVDPPYGIHEKLTRPGKGSRVFSRLYDDGSWKDQAPDISYFEELFRVSKNQIIWGGNYFSLPPCRGFIFWDKMNPCPNYSDGEFAWTSFDVPAKKHQYGYTNVINYEPRIHPTQKPVPLYKWLLSRYAKHGDRILDTHGGSGSICIACHDLGFDLTWMELDKDYYDAACERYKTHAAQAQLFEPQEIRQVKQAELLEVAK